MPTLKSGGVLAHFGTSKEAAENMKAPSAPVNDNRSKAIDELISTERTFVSEMTVSYCTRYMVTAVGYCAELLADYCACTAGAV
jgi:hypothetical protein